MMHPIWKCWLLADRVYMDKDVINKVLPSDMRMIGFFQGLSDHCLVMEDDQNVYIAFPGTNDGLDMVSNLDCGFLKTHKSIVETYEQFKVQITSLLKKRLYKNWYSTGHSRGSGVAKVCAQSLSIIKPLSCIAFSPVAIHKKDEREYYNKLPIDHLNIYVEYDLVTCSLLIRALGYRHVGRDHVFKKPFYWALLKLKAHMKKEVNRLVKIKWGPNE